MELFTRFYILKGKCNYLHDCQLTDGVIFKGLKMDDSKEKNGSDGFGPEDDLLGSNSEIAVKLRQFYTAIQEEEIPEKFLDLLEKLDKAEQGSQS